MSKDSDKTIKILFLILLGTIGFTVGLVVIAIATKGHQLHHKHAYEQGAPDGKEATQ